MAATAAAAPVAPIVFSNLRLFDGKSDALIEGLRVVVEGKTIKSVEPAEAPLAHARVVDCGGRVLMPGLIDAHWHAMMASLPMSVLLTADVGYLTLVAADEARRTLMRGFTSVRDMAGPTFSLKRAIDNGLVAGPRIWPSGAMISQTGGHGDFRFPHEIPASPNAPLSRGEAIGGGAIADGVDRVLQRAREQLMLGASQLKLAAGGGVSSHYDPIDVSQYTEPEFRAAVDAAENWGTYVAVHAYTPRAIETAIRGGVRCIEHGHLMDEATAELIAKNGIWLSTQPFLNNEYSSPQATPEGEAKAQPSLRGNGRGLQIRQGVQHQDGVGHGYLVRFQHDRSSGRDPDDARALVSPGGNPQDGDRGQRRTLGDVRPAQSLSGQARRDRGWRACRPHRRRR